MQTLTQKTELSGVWSTKGLPVEPEITLISSIFRSELLGYRSLKVMSRSLINPSYSHKIVCQASASNKKLPWFWIPLTGISYILGSVCPLPPQSGPKSSPCSECLPSSIPQCPLCHVAYWRIRQHVLHGLCQKCLTGRDGGFSCFLSSHSAQCTEIWPRNREHWLLTVLG